MRTVFEARASTILYKLLCSMPQQKGVFLLPANICPIVPFALLTAQRSFEFIDIDANTLCIDIKLIRCRIKDDTKDPVAGIIYVRSYGINSDLSLEFMSLKTRWPNIILIDDKCLCRPDLDTFSIQSGADVVLYSTGHAKYIDLGFGGFAYLKASLNYDNIDRNFSSIDLNFINSLYKEAITKEQPLVNWQNKDLRNIVLKFPAWLDFRPVTMSWSEYEDRILVQRALTDHLKKEYNSLYESIIPVDIQLSPVFNQWRFQIQTDQKIELINRIFLNGLFASGHFYPASRLFFDARFPEVEKLYCKCVNLFNDFNVSIVQVEKTAKLVYRFFTESKVS